MLITEANPSVRHNGSHESTLSNSLLCSVSLRVRLTWMQPKWGHYTVNLLLHSQLSPGGRRWKGVVFNARKRHQPLKKHTNTGTDACVPKLNQMNPRGSTLFFSYFHFLPQVLSSGASSLTPWVMICQCLSMNLNRKENSIFVCL